ncbi:MAG: hypothetical protein K6T26_03025 [Alicyclobacillus sp.]|nr:hypothetical protein [Alicyclobacillus sp.]
MVEGLRIQEFNGWPLDWQQRSLSSAGQQAGRGGEAARAAQTPAAETQGAAAPAGALGRAAASAADEARAERLERFRALVQSGQPLDLPKLADALTRAGVLPAAPEE